RDAALKLAAADRAVTEAEEKLAALERYRGEYEQQLAQRGSTGVDISGVREFQAFLARLGDAVSAQRAVLEQVRVARDGLQATWREAAKRAQAVGKLTERWQDEARRDEDRRNQRESDELAQRGLARKNER